MVQRDRRSLVFKILTVTLLLVFIFLVSNACLGQIITRAPGISIQQTIVLNLLYGQQYFGVPHIYQGCIFNTRCLIYYGPSNASLYWAEGNLSSDQPVLELTSIGFGGGPGVMFWNGYFNGGNITVSMIGTYSSGGMRLANGSSYPSGGFVIYLFLNPTTWNISPQYNYTTINGSMTVFESPMGDAILLLPSSTPYLIIQWEPFWQFGYTQSGATGQWNVWIVTNTNGGLSVSPSPSPNLGQGYRGWGGIGIGAFHPNPGDLIDITVTYDPSTNTLTGIAYDMNTTQSASFTLNLNGYYTPPSSGNYVFGVGASFTSPAVLGEHYNHTGIGYPNPFFSSNNWALLYTAVSQQLTTPPTPSSSSLGCSRAAVLALRQILGGEYQVGQFISANSNSLSCLYFGTVNGQLYELSSRLYFIEPPGINSIVLYPPGSSYWNGLNSNLYVLQLMPNVKGWSNDNLVVNSSNVPYSGGNYTVILVGTYTQYSWTNYNYPADGFYVSMFVKPVAALVNETANYTIPEFKLVESQTPYLIVGWDPISAVWPVGPGEFKIAVVYPNGTYVTLLDEGGQGHIQGLEPGDLILMKVTYDSYTNAIYAEVVDLNSSSEVNITFPLGNYFTPPQPGYYWTSVYSWSGWEAANWGIVYYAVSATTQQTPTPPTPSTPLP
jgi:hypothetical protein